MEREIFDNMHRIAPDDTGDPVRGRVVYAPAKSLPLLALYAATVAGFVFYFRIDAIAVFALKTAMVLLLGHSVGMHRRLIHKSFDCPLWFERLLVYMGALVGLGGPFTMIRTHDFRDWAQRQPHCHDYFAHRQPPLIDAFWQMHCELKLDRPPRLRIETRVADDPVLRFIENHPVLIHLPWVAAFYAMGGMAWVVWGVCTQVAVTITGHWLVGYMAHARHDGDWQVRGAGVQGRNVPFSGWLSMGECWHNNHHAFPGSARIGLYPGQSDPGYRFLKAMEAFGLVSNLRLPHHLAARSQLQWSGPETRPVMRDDLKPCPLMLRAGQFLGLQPRS